MVYCGKPSKGCQMCRTRRIKCDETKPTCNQCAKARRQCPGYRDDFDIMLRNENRSAEMRALKANDKRKRKPKPPSPPKDNNNKQLVALPSPIAALPIPTKDLATSHFISNFILLPSSPSTQARGYMDFLIPLINTPDKTPSHLLHAFQACALASLGTRAQSVSGQDPLHSASLEYMKALQATQSALVSPALCTSDSVLAAVLLLSTYENITAPNGCAWGSHIQGAVQLVKARGKKNLLASKVGLQLFIAVRTQLIIQTLTSSTPPPLGPDWWSHPSAALDPHASHCQRLNLLTSQLRSEIVYAMSASRPPSHSTIRLLLSRAQDLDHQVDVWLSTLPASFRPTTVSFAPNISTTASAADYRKMINFPGGRIDSYPDVWAASVVNMARTTRLVLHSLIVRCAAWCVSPTDYRTTKEYVVAKRVCEEVISGIIASVGFCLGRGVGGKERNLGPGVGVLGGYLLTWPLSCVMGQDYASDAQRAYAIGRLKYIGDELGIRYSHILAQLHVRVPSMLIRRDGLLAKPYPMAHDFEKLILGSGARDGPPVLSGYKLNPLQQREVMIMEEKEKGKNELVKKAVGGAKEEEVVFAAKKMLVV
ncbi:hypothetical protein QBC38DRAFT_389365 [Podospora fimiseda]|uniref:Zn(2)-C6 fungal-type domain-containing protein n=1 Tax=Podospora fimiseda TaxID=252190 RepID=A0AAN7H5D5_9PEZI|nr:hypothetical protein QBC38DRAFT_389365 [Podospora fimiseda]